MWHLKMTAIPQWFLGAMIAVPSSVRWDSSNSPSQDSFLIRPVLQLGSEHHSWKLNLESLLQSSPESPSYPVSFQYALFLLRVSLYCSELRTLLKCLQWLPIDSRMCPKSSAYLKALLYLGYTHSVHVEPLCQLWSHGATLILLLFLKPILPTTKEPNWTASLLYVSQSPGLFLSLA